MYPAMINLTDQKVTIVGGGKVALRKAKAFLEFGGKVTVMSHDFAEGFDRLSVNCIQGQYKETDLESSFIVVAATNDPEVNKQIGIYCKKRRILCNVIDNPDLSSFIVPAYMKRGDLIIGISTHGKSPSLASKIKQDLSQIYDESYEEYLDILGRIREKVVANYEDESEKKKILHYVITLSLEELRAYEKSHFSC